MRNRLLFTLLLLISGVVYAGGYRVATQGQRALAMGHSGVAVVNSAELAFFNPSGLVYLEDKLNIAAGVTGIYSNVSWQSPSTGGYAQTDNGLGTPFYLYASYKATENLTVGLSVYTPYGSAVDWPTDWAGSHLINNIDLEAIYIQPLISYKITDFLSVGGGPIFVTGSVNLNRNLNRSLADENGDRSNVTVDASGVTKWGWSASAMITPTEHLRIGINYRSEIIVDAKNGDATFANVPNSPLAPVQNGTYDFNASLPLPAELTVGFSYKFYEKWLFAFDYNRDYWGVYESLDINFVPSSIPDSKNPRNYKDASTYRFGLQYEITAPLTLRIGYYYDQSPVPIGLFCTRDPAERLSGIYRRTFLSDYAKDFHRCFLCLFAF